MILVLVLTIAIALVTRPGRAAALKSERLRRIVPVLDAVCLFALIAIPVLAALTIAGFRTSDSGKLASSGRATSPTSATHGSAAGKDGKVVELANTGPETTTTAAAASTVCRNSTDPVCGPFRWDPAPGPNAPIEISITYSPSAPRIGEEVLVTVRARDADALIGDVTLTFGDEDVVTIPPASINSCDGVEAGPWALPSPTPDDIVKTFRHAYSSAGDFTIAAYAASPEIASSTCPPNPYASQATASSPIHPSAG